MRVARTPPGPPSTRGRVKVCLVGDREVGKTALAERFVFAEHRSGYRPTQGLRIYRKRLGLTLDRGRHLLDLEVWDGPGDPRVYALLERGFLHDADGVFLVVDASRRDTVPDLVPWAEAVHRRVPTALRAVLVNKGDARRRVGPDAVGALTRPAGIPWLFVSARANRNVDKAFVSMATWVLERHLERRGRPAAAPLL